MSIDGEDFRILPCEHCQGEGRLYSGHPNDPNPRDDGECPVCEGTGGEWIRVNPITLDDLDDPPPSDRIALGDRIGRG